MTGRRGRNAGEKKGAILRPVESNAKYHVLSQ